ncbi:Blue-light-activated protein [Phycisphaerae bacterium RAS1]|nr:Blue-light-activated protein [Phycisphaerae bacterium RAS1]
MRDARSSVRRWALGPWVSTGLVVSLVVLVVITALAGREFQLMSDQLERVDRTYDVISSLNEVLTLLVDAETAQRGYLLTGDEAYLSLLEAAGPRLVRARGVLEAPADGDAALLERFRRLGALAETKLEHLGNAVRLARSGDVDAAHEQVRSGRGKAIMDDVRALLAQATADVRDDRSRQRGEAAGSRRSATTLAALGLVLGGSVLTAAVALNRQFRQAAIRTHAANESLIEILETMGECFAHLDDEWRYRYVNARGLSYMGRGSDEVLGKVMWDVFPQLRASQMEAQFRRAAQERVPVEFESPSIAFSDRLIEVRAIPTAAGMSIFWRDISERKRMREQLLHALKLESVGRLAGGVAHDFNNLLTAITGAVDLAAQQMAEEHPALPHLRQVQSAVQRAAELTRQLLAFARKQVIAPQVVDINAIVRETEPLLRRLLNENILVSVVCAEILWPVEVDPVQIQQVLLNLAANARDAMRDGGRLLIETGNARLDENYTRQHPDVHIGDYVMLTISDTGAGMEAAIQQHIFEPFFSTKQAGEGTGLGLASVHGIVQQAGGHIWLYSEPGRGTTFKIHIPRSTRAPHADEARPEPAVPAVGSGTVLVVEDEPMIRQIAQMILSKKGYTALTAGTAEEALVQLEARNGAIDVVVTDVMLPGRSGRQLADLCAARWPAVRFLFTSGYTENAIVHGGVLASGVQFMHKPYSATTLLQRVAQVLAGAAASTTRGTPR